VSGSSGVDAEKDVAGLARTGPTACPSALAKHRFLADVVIGGQDHDPCVRVALEDCSSASSDAERGAAILRLVRNTFAGGRPASERHHPSACCSATTVETRPIGATALPVAGIFEQRCTDATSKTASDGDSGRGRGQRA